MSNTENRIKLAEFVGWEWHHLVDYPNKDSGQWSLHGMFRDWSIKSDLPFNPYEDANDCEALISKLTSMGWNVEIYHGTYTQDVRDEDPDHIYINGYRVFVHIWNIDTEEHHRKDMDQDSWKQGVCELALKVIDEDT